MSTDDYEDEPPAGAGEVSASRRRWLDHLVELHVLSEHGDLTAAAAATAAMAGDSHARQAWDEVERIRDQLRAQPR